MIGNDVLATSRSVLRAAKHSYPSDSVPIREQAESGDVPKNGHPRGS